MGRTAGLSLVFAVLVVGCGGDDGAPVDPDGMVVDPDANPDSDAPTTSASHVAGVYRELTVTLTADEPASIHYTTDGSTPTTASAGGPRPLDVDIDASATLRFFAVDDAGNEETPQELALVVDRLGPAAIASLGVTPVSSNVNLSWTNPTDAGYTRTVIALVTDLSTTMPADGTDYAVNDIVGAAKIVYAGTGTAFSDVGRGPGHHTYVAWAQYDTGVYSEGRTIAQRVSTPTQACRIDLTATAATVAVQSAYFPLAVSNFSNSAGTITVDVKMTSALPGIAFNPKLVFTGITGSGGTPTFVNAAGTLTGTPAGPYFYFGPNGLRAGASAIRRLTVNTNGATTAQLTCQVIEDPGIFSSEWECPIDPANAGGIVDARTGGITTGLPLPGRYAEHEPVSRPPGDGCSNWQSLVLSPDQRYLYAGPRSNKVIAKIDTTTMAAVALHDVAVNGTSASAGKLVLDPSGRRLYVGVNDGGHGGGYLGRGGASRIPPATGNVQNLVLEVSTATMSETSRLQVGSGDQTHRLIRTVLSPDGRILAVVIGANYEATPNNELHFYDTASWTELDADTTTAGIQPFALGTLRASTVAFDGTGRYAAIGVGGDVTTNVDFGLVDLENLTLQTIASPVATGNRRVSGATWDVAAFWVWITNGQTQLYRLNPATGVITPDQPFGQSISGIKDAVRVGNTLYVIGGSGTYAVNATTGAVQTTYGRPRNLHTVALTR